MNGILDAALRKNPHVRIVATAVTLESVGALAARMADFEKAECVSLQAARARTAGSYHLMQGTGMKWSLFALCIGFCIDLLIGDPHGLPHPVAAIGHLISLLERLFRRLFPKTPGGERAAGACIWILTVLIAAALPALLLWGCARVSVWLRLAVESVMCGQILAAKSLRDESMKVYAALKHGSLDEARQAVSMIVGRDVARLDARGVMRAAVETVAENTSDGVIAPMLFLVIGGAPLGFFYKAVNTMDSMLGYVEPRLCEF